MREPVVRCFMGEEERLLRPAEQPKPVEPALGNPPGDLIHDAFGVPGAAGSPPAEKTPDEKPGDKPADAPAVPATDSSAAPAAADAAPPPFVAMDAATRTREIEELRRAGTLTGDDQKRNEYLQQTLHNLGHLFMDDLPRLANEKDQDYAKRLADDVSRRRERLELEKEAGVFGPATKAEFEKYVSWLQQRAIPEAVREMDGLKIAMPTGCPIGLPADQYQRTITPDLYKALAANNELTLNMGLDTKSLPSEKQLQKLDDAYNWLTQCNESATDARAQHQDRVLNQLLGEMGLPEGWRRKEGEDPAAWRASAAEMVDLATRTRNYVEAMQSLYKKSRDRDFPLEFPPGTEVTIKHGTETYKVTDKDLNEKTWLLRGGTITDVKLDLPKDLRQDNPANAAKIERLREWITRHGDRIDQALDELRTQNPESVVMYGDQEVKNGRGRFNEKGEFIGIAGPKDTAGPGETLRDLNLIGHDFEVKDLGNGKFEISQTVQAEKAPWYAYQNFRCLGVEKIGSPMKIDTRTMDGDSFIPVRNGDKIEIVQVKNLARFKAAQAFAYWGEKGLVAAMDASMLVGGGIGISAAVRGARLAATGATAALRLTGTQAAWQIAHNSTRVAVAGAGIFNNAGGRSLHMGNFAVGEHINTARGLYFLGDISQGLARGGWNMFRGAKAAESAARATAQTAGAVESAAQATTQTLSVAERMHTLIHGENALVKGAEALKGMPFVRHVHSATEFTFKATELAFAPVIASELSGQAKQLKRVITGGDNRDPLKDALIQVGDGRGLQTARDGAFNPKDHKAVEGAHAVLDNYAHVLTAGRPDDVRNSVNAVFEDAKKLIGPDAKPEDRAAFLQKLQGNVAFTGEDIRAIEQAHPANSSRSGFTLQNEQINELLDPVKRRKFPIAVQNAVEKILEGKNPDLAAASRIAMLYVARNADGKVPATLSEKSVSVPGYERSYEEPSGEGTVTVTVKVEPRTASETITTKEIVDQSKRDLESSTLGNRGIAVGDVLTRIGALTHQQYGGVLQDVLANAGAGRDDKMRALIDPYGARFTTILDGTRYAESMPRTDQTAVQRQREEGQHFGLSSAAMMATLENTAKNDRDPDVRAMAAAQIYGLRERDAEQRSKILSALNTLWSENQNPPGEFAKKANEFVQRHMETAVPTDNPKDADIVRERKFNAAMSLALATPATEAATQRAINKAIADSFSTTNPNLAVKVVDALVPDRINQLATTDAAMANSLRAAVVEQTRTVPDTRAKGEAIEKMLGKIEPLLRGADVSLKQQLCRNLESLLDNNQYNKNYAEHYPNIRVAALGALAALGSRDSIDAIRRHATAEAKLAVGPKQLEAAEPNATVRMAAIKALETLRDPEIRSYLATLIDKETDPQVASRLRDIRFFQERLEPGSREYQEIRQRIEAAVINPSAEAKYPHITTFGQDRARNWLNENFDLLNHTTFRSRAQSAIDDAAWGFPNVFRSRESIFKLEKDAGEGVLGQRNGQWNRLVEFSRQESADGDLARRALFYIATSPVADILGAGGESAGLYSDYDNNHRFDDMRNQNWRYDAAVALSAACGTGCGSRDMTAHYVEQALTATSGLGPDSRKELLKGLKELAKTNSAGEPGITREKLAQTLSRALELELRRPSADQNEEYQQQLVRSLKEMQYRMAVPVFDGLSRSRFPSVQKEAGDALVELRDSVSLIWDQTTVDQNATPKQRADRLSAALTDTNNAERTVQEIFGAYKGHRISDEKDPGLAQLQVALQDTNERVRLAAARILVDAQIPNSNPVKASAIRALTDLVMGSKNAYYRKDAFAELGKLDLTKPIPLMPLNSSSRMLLLEKVGGKVKGTEYDGDNEVGWIYPNGGSMRVQMEGNTLVGFTENGETYQRVQEDASKNRKAGGPLQGGSTWLNEWQMPGNPTPWKGVYTMLGKGSYWFQRENQPKRFTRSTEGAWTETQVPWTAQIAAPPAAAAAPR